MQILLFLHLNVLFGQEKSPWIIVEKSLNTVQRGSVLSKSKIRRVEIPSGKENEFFQALESRDEVILVERDWEVNALLNPNDPFLERQWYLSNRQQGPSGLRPDLQAPLGWDISRGSREIVVGVLDSGIDWQHADLVQNIWQNLGEDLDGDGSVLEWNGSRWIFDPGDQNGIDDDNNGYIDDFVGWDFVNNDNDPSDDHIFGHGTHVSGIIGAAGNNGIGISGVAWEVQLMALKFLDSNGRGYLSAAIEAMQYALANGAKISNHSWGGPNFSQAFSLVLEEARLQGHLAVAAAGNNYGNDNDLAPIYPASYPSSNVISVGATNLADSSANFSNFGRNSVDLFAPGLGIYSTLPNGQYGYLSGTSMAAPMVTGGAVLLLAQSPEIQLTEIKEKIFRSVSALPSLKTKCSTEGRLNLFQLLNRPVLFQLQEDRRTLAADAFQSGKWVQLEKGTELVLICRNKKGQIENSQILADSFLTHLHCHDSLGILVAGSHPDSQYISVLNMQQNGHINWNKKYNWGTNSSLEGINIIENKIYLWGQSTLGGSWIAALDSVGNMIWSKSIDFSGKKSRLTSIIKGEAGELYGLGELEGGKILLGRLQQATGTPLEMRTFEFSNTTEVKALAIKSNLEEEVAFIFQSRSGGSAWQVGSLEWEPEDQEIEDSFTFNINSPGVETVAAFGPEGYIMVIGSAGNKNFLSIIQNNQFVSSQLLTWDSIPLSPIHLEWNGGLGAFFSHPNLDKSIFTLTDLQGRLLCNQSPAGFSLSGGNQVSTKSENFTYQNLLLTSQTRSSSAQPVILADSLLCDNTNCNTRAFFLLNSLSFCPEENISLNNLSTQATGQTWYLDGIPFSTDSQPLWIAPEDEGTYRLTLSAENGACLDTFGTNIQVVSLPELPDIDTLHCGPNFTFEVEETSPTFLYQWKDENENILDTLPQIKLDSSGNYKLSLSNACGESKEMSLNLALQPGCVWPGDANADGEVNMDDYLLIGTLNGNTGPQRPNASPIYYPQPSPDWPLSLPTDHDLAPSVNFKHADADGNGLIDLKSDGDIVKRNFTKSSKGAYSDSSKIEASFILKKNLIATGDTALFTVEAYHKDSIPIQNIYGASLIFDFNVPLSVPIQVQTSSSILNKNSGTDSLIRIAPGQKRFEVGISRLNNNGTNGKGLLMAGGITIFIDDIGTGRSYSGNSFFTMALSEVKLIQPDGSLIPVNGLSSLGNQTLVIKDSLGTTTEVEQFDPEDAVLPFAIGPNPSSGSINIIAKNFEGFLHPVSLQVIDLNGKVIFEEDFMPQQGKYLHQIQLPNLARGHLWLKMIHKHQLFVFPIVLIKDN